jgi:osmoprotectant transport system ATP-binding protein
VQPTGTDAPQSMIVLDRVRKQYADGTVAVEELSLDVGLGQIAVLVGPSGCGKTTTMRMVNRLVEPTSGRIVLDGDDISQVDRVALRRRIGYVIQQVGLFPHQTVADNVATVPQLLGWDKRRTRARVAELLELVGLDVDRHAKRYPHELSGGQRQRVGVARALAADPPVLLMDEPFGAVDPVARDRLQAEFLRLQEQVRKTIVFVTHDIDEAIRLGDHIAVMREGGHLEQYADPKTLLSEPATPFVADFVGADRTLRRLSVLTVDPSLLVRWPVVSPDTTATDAVAVVDEAEAAWAVVAAGDDVRGWLSRETARAASSGPAGSLAVPAAVVGVEASLEQALAALLGTGGPGVVVVGPDGYAGVLTESSVLTGARRNPGRQSPG